MGVCRIPVSRLQQARPQGPRESHFFRAVRRLLNRERGHGETAAFMDKAYTHYADLIDRLPPYRSRAERMAYELGAFGLALYRTLREESWEQDAAVDRVARLIWEPLKVIGSIVSLYRRTPGPMLLWKATVKLASRTIQGPPAWEYTWLEPGEAFDLGFNVTSCAYWEYFRRMGAPEVARAYCQGDIYIAEQLAPAIEFHRTKTLATGGDCCDFRYRRRRHKAEALLE